MFETGSAVAVAMFAWWFLTGAILFLSQLSRSAVGWSMVAVTVVACLAVWTILEIRQSATLGGAFAGFLAGLVIWGWHELSFLTGLVTGPCREPCPDGLSGWGRFMKATGTLISHEIAIFLTLIALIAFSLDSANNVALVTFASLWILRLSAKFNIFLGIPNLSDELLPARLDYLRSYFRNRPMNPLFPISVTGGTLMTAFLLLPAFAANATPFDATAAMLVGTLVGLGVLEHWLMVLPIRDAALWRWALRAGEGPGAGCEASDRGVRIPTTTLNQREPNPYDGREAAIPASALMGGKS
jgi:putative photosynthetic complex assembly protein 2